MTDVLNNPLFTETNNGECVITSNLKVLFNKIQDYRNFKNIEIEDDSELNKQKQEAEIEKIQKEIESLQGRQMSALKKMDQMRLMLEISSLKTELKLKNLDLEDVIEDSKEKYLKKLSEHQEAIKLKENALKKDTNDYADFIEKTIKNSINGSKQLSPKWNEIRSIFLAGIEDQKKEFEIFSLRLEELNHQKEIFFTELEKAKNEKEFLQGKMELNLIEEKENQLKLVDSKIDEVEKKMKKLEREEDAIKVKREGSNDKINIIQNTIDEIISENLAEDFKNANATIPEFLKNVKYFSSVEIDNM